MFVILTETTLYQMPIMFSHNHYHRHYCRKIDTRYAKLLHVWTSTRHYLLYKKAMVLCEILYLDRLDRVRLTKGKQVRLPKSRKSLKPRDQHVKILGVPEI